MRSLLVLRHIPTCHQKANVNIRCTCIPVSACRHRALVRLITFLRFLYTSIQKRMCPVSLAFFKLRGCRVTYCVSGVSFLHIRTKTDVYCFSCVLLLLLLLLLLSTFQMIIAHRQLILMKLCDNDQWSCLHLWHDLWSRRCHIGVTKVKKVNFSKIATPPTVYIVLSCDSCIWFS